MNQVRRLVPGWFATMIVASAAICMYGLSQPQLPDEQPQAHEPETDREKRLHGEDVKSEHDAAKDAEKGDGEEQLVHVRLPQSLRTVAHAFLRLHPVRAGGG